MSASTVLPRACAPSSVVSRPLMRVSVLAASMVVSACVVLLPSPLPRAPLALTYTPMPASVPMVTPTSPLLARLRSICSLVSCCDCSSRSRAAARVTLSPSTRLPVMVTSPPLPAPPRGDLHRLAADHGADGVAVAVGVVRGGGLAAQYARLLAGLVHLQAVGFIGGGEADVARGGKGDAAGVAHHRGRLQGQVVAGLQHDVAAGFETAAAHGFAGGLHRSLAASAGLRAVVG